MTQQFLVQLVEDFHALDKRFNVDLALNFEDGSICDFSSAFYKVNGSVLEVFTEHCGYHGFPIMSLESVTINTYDEKGRLHQDLDGFLELEERQKKLEELLVLAGIN